VSLVLSFVIFIFFFIFILFFTTVCHNAHILYESLIYVLFLLRVGRRRVCDSKKTVCCVSESIFFLFTYFIFLDFVSESAFNFRHFCELDSLTRSRLVLFRF
jgi:hypothetical protein